MPFLFVYTSILNVGWNFYFFLTVIDCIIALMAWGAAMEGYLLKETSLFERICLFAGALGLLHEGIVTDIVGVSLFIMVIIIQKITIARIRKKGLEVNMKVVE